VGGGGGGGGGGGALVDGGIIGGGIIGPWAVEIIKKHLESIWRREVASQASNKK